MSSVANSCCKSIFETSRWIKHEKKHDNSKPKAKDLSKIRPRLDELTLSPYSFQCFGNSQGLITADSSEIFCCKNAKEGQPLLTITELYRNAGCVIENPGGPTAASSADRLLAHTQQAFTDTPKKQQNNDRRCSDFDYNQSYALS